MSARARSVCPIAAARLQASVGRRPVVLGAVGVAAAGLLAACGDDSTSPAAEGTSSASSSSSTSESSGSSSSAAGGAVLVALADIPVGGAVSAETPDGEPILVAQPTAGEVVAFSAICTHQGCTVAPGDGSLDCPCHGSTFDIATGERTGGPAPSPLPAFAVAVSGTDVVVA